MANIIQTFPKGTGGGQSIQFDSMPTASSDLEGRIVQYTGTTDTTYTNGWFYKCVEDSTTTPSTYEWERVELSDLMPASDMSEVVDHLPAIGPTPGGSGGYDNVIEGYYNYSDSLFYYDSAFTLPVDGENRVIYLSLDTNIIYRYDGSIFIPLATVSDIQVVSLPTAGGSHENEIYQYIGATDSTYTNGWFYKCVKDTTTTPVSYSWEKVEMIEYMPAEDMGEIIPTMPSVQVAYPVTYSTDEQLIGKWIDGKDLYQKTFTYSGTISMNNSHKNTNIADISGLNIDTLISIDGCYKTEDAGFFYKLFYSDIRGNRTMNSTAFIAEGYLKVSAYRSDEYTTTIRNIVVTIQYTKTT